MKKLAIILAALALSLFSLDLMTILSKWTFGFLGEGSQLPFLPVLSFLLFAIASFVGFQSEKHGSLSLAGMVFLLMLIGYLLKTMHWPGANIVVMVSFGAFIFVVIPWFTAYLLKSPPKTMDTVIEEDEEEESEIEAEES